MPTTPGQLRAWVETQADGKDRIVPLHRRHICSRAYFAAFHCLKHLAKELLPVAFHVRLDTAGSHPVLRELFPGDCPIMGETGKRFSTLNATRQRCEYDLDSDSPSIRELDDTVARMSAVFAHVGGLASMQKTALAKLL